MSPVAQSFAGWNVAYDTPLAHVPKRRFFRDFNDAEGLVDTLLGQGEAPVIRRSF